MALPKRTGQIGRASAQAPAVAASKLECKVLSSDGHARLQSAQDMSPGVEQQDFQWQSIFSDLERGRICQAGSQYSNVLVIALLYAAQF